MVKKKRRGLLSSAGIDEAYRRLAGFVGGLLLVVLGPLISYFFWQDVKESRASMSWPSTPGRIIESRSEPVWRGKTRVMELRVTYNFVVNGRTYSGQRIHIGSSTVGDAASLPVGATPQVFYDPADPKTCALELGGSPIYLWFGILLGPVLVLIGTAYLLSPIAWLMRKVLMKRVAVEDDDRPKKRRGR